MPPSVDVEEESRWAPASCFHPKNFSLECVRQREDALPQHNLDLPFPEGRTGRYITFLNQYIHMGFNK